MEGFETRAYDEILGLGAEGLAAVAVVTLGRRAEDDADAAQPKVRMPASDLILRR
jgi:nitroreductase/dihydropteridine reductase